MTEMTEPDIQDKIQSLWLLIRILVCTSLVASYQLALTCDVCGSKCGGDECISLAKSCY